MVRRASGIPLAADCMALQPFDSIWTRASVSANPNLSSTAICCGGQACEAQVPMSRSGSAASVKLVQQNNDIVCSLEPAMALRASLIRLEPRMNGSEPRVRALAGPSTPSYRLGEPQAGTLAPSVKLLEASSQGLPSVLHCLPSK